MESSIPLEEHVKQRYLQNISSIGVDPTLIALIEGINTSNPSTRLLTIGGINRPSILLGFRNKLYTQQQFKGFRSLQAYNQMVSGFIASVQGHVLVDKFVVLAAKCGSVV